MKNFNANYRKIKMVCIRQIIIKLIIIYLHPNDKRAPDQLSMLIFWHNNKKNKHNQLEDH